jgi:aspartyl aminopeptidase
VLADKEEIGSDGVTGMQSAAFDTFMEDLCEAQGVAVRVCLEKSFCLSADVTAAYDPDYAEVYEKRNAALINYGIGLCKYTGARGKSGASDADAETVAYVRRVFDDADVIWQIAELGKTDVGGGGTVAMSKYTGHGGKVGTNDAPAEYVAWIRKVMADAGVIWQAGDMGKTDVGGGGTVAKFIAKHNIETVDMGVPVIAMHAPYEIISKADIYTAHLAFEAFFRA